MKPSQIPGLVIAISGLLFTPNAAADDLASVYQQALDADPTWLAARAAHQAALEARPQSLAALLPDIALTGSYTRDRFDPRTTGATSYATNQTYTLGLRQPLFRRDRFVQLEQADSRIARADAQLAAAGQDLVIRVATAYFAVLGAQDNLAFVQADKQAISRTLDQAEQRFKVGLAAITDSLKAQAAYDIAISNEIGAEQQLADSHEALRELTGTLPGTLEVLQAGITLLQPEPAEPSGWVAAAGRQNPNILAAQAAVTTAREEIRVSRAGHLPSVDLTASYSYRDNLFGGITALERDDSAVGLELSLPIYQGGGTVSRTRQARQLYNQALEEQTRQQRATERQVRDNFRGVMSSISKVNALAKAIESSEKAYEAAQAGFDVGTRDIVDVLDAQRELLGARRDHARSRYDYLLNTLRLKQAAGILEVGDLLQINEWLVKND